MNHAEEYKMFYESAEKVTERRLSTNRWYYSICTAILAASALILNWITTNPDFLMPAVLLVGVLCGIAILFCIYWIAQINDFKMLNKAKFSIINEMAPYVSFSPEPSDTRVSYLPFKKEWDQLKESKTRARVLRSRMMGNYHVRFCSGGGAGDCSTDRNEPDRPVSTEMR